eukprot:scaffold302493_cov17-Tisochrysis_lutea.AAC.2
MPSTFHPLTFSQPNCSAIGKIAVDMLLRSACICKYNGEPVVVVHSSNTFHQISKRRPAMASGHRFMACSKQSTAPMNTMLMPLVMELFWTNL